MIWINTGIDIGGGGSGSGLGGHGTVKTMIAWTVTAAAGFGEGRLAPKLSPRTRLTNPPTLGSVWRGQGEGEGGGGLK